MARKARPGGYPLRPASRTPAWSGPREQAPSAASSCWTGASPSRPRHPGRARRPPRVSLVVDAAPPELLGQGAPGQPAPVVPRLHPCPRECPVIDQANVGEPAEDILGDLSGYAALPERGGELRPGPGRERQQLQAYLPRPRLRVLVLFLLPHGPLCLPPASRQPSAVRSAYGGFAGGRSWSIRAAGPAPFDPAGPAAPTGPACRGHGGLLVQARADAELLLDLLLDLVGHVGVVAQEVAGVLLALAELVAVVGVPGAGLAHDPLLDAEVDQPALPADPEAVDDVELGLLERRATSCS